MFKAVSQLDSAVNFKEGPRYNSHHILRVSLHYLAKYKKIK